MKKLTFIIAIALLTVTTWSEDRTPTAEYLAFEATLDVLKVLNRSLVDSNAQVYDISVLVTTKDDRIVNRVTQPVVEVSPGVWKMLGKEVKNYVAPEATEASAEENLAAGQDRLEEIIALGIAIPSSPTEALPLKVRPKEWHGKVIVDYAALKDDVKPAGVNAVAIAATIKDPATDIQEEVFAIITVRKPKPLTEGGTPVALYVVDKLKIN